MIILPVVGMVCVARFSEHSRYYRAKVTDDYGDWWFLWILGALGW